MAKGTKKPVNVVSADTSQTDNETKTLNTPAYVDDTTKTLDTTQPGGENTTSDKPQADDKTRSLKKPHPDDTSKTHVLSDSDLSAEKLEKGTDSDKTQEDDSYEEEEWGEEEVKAKKVEERTEGSLQSCTWSNPDFKTDWSDFEITVEDQRYDDSDIKIDAADLYYPGVHVEEGRVHINENHGYTFVDTTEIDANGNKKIVRKFLPRIYQKTRTYKKLVPVKVTFTKITNDVELVEEEEDINEEMEVDEIISTCLVKKKDQQGEEIEEEKVIVQEIIKHPGKKNRYMKLKMINDLGEQVEELILLTDDPKRTNAIMKLAAPYLKKKAATPDDTDSFQGYDKAGSMIRPEWYNAKTAHKDLIKLQVIERLKKARDEQKALKKLNRYLGKRLCEFYDLKGSKDPNFVYDERGNSEEGKQKYQKRLLEFNDVVNFIFNENKKRVEMISEAEKNTQHNAEELKKEKQNFYGLEEAMLNEVDPAEESKTLRCVTFAELINQQKLMDTSLAKVRLEFIRSQITLKDLQDKNAAHENAINNMEKVDFISFESLRMKTKDLNDKLDLKEKQVLLMKDRLTQRVQALAHVRLKSDHLTVENEKLRADTKDVIEELDALRKECLLVQIERRKLEKQLSKVTSKEGIEKYPYLMSEVGTVEAKGEEQQELLGHLVNTCTDLKSKMKEKLEQHRLGVKKYQKIQEQKKQKKKMFSFEFK